ncbi:regulatory protein NosR [Alkalilimnicola ehrlichii]|uniref:Regulatory protein NosR n=1 Tax=Alkalilimnicola ehrlichii TaxID=351052 RepID=A0A3E0WKW2_9GAMM|nr:NosR/NirI family protein [Alkalilimnicola ehrlichii]RFA25761.1 regulatory protein NosR [Alkalilimnicola ehrlichii]RFA32843.1 regulatory protein NosR [Alkalilimnicola ehrlichii]
MSIRLGLVAFACALLGALLWLSVSAAATHPFFPDATRIAEPSGEPKVRAVYRNDELLGYLFETNDVAPIPAYSGKPVNMLVGLSVEGRITGVEVIEHHEPIMLVGIPESALDDFVGQYITRSVRERVRVGRSRRVQPDVVNVDAVSGATVTVVVMGEGIMRSAHVVAQAYGLSVGGEGAVARVYDEVFYEAGWEALREEGAIGRLHLTRGEVDEAFVGSEAEGVGVAAPGTEDDTFIDFYYAYASAPTIGRNLLGEANYERLMSGLAEDEHAILLMARGEYSFRGSGYVRGGIFDRIHLHQGSHSLSFRDRDYLRFRTVAPEDAPRLAEIGAFVIRAEHGFDPGKPWEIDLLVRRQTGPLDSVFITFSGEYQLPAHYFEAPSAVNDAASALWVEVWRDRVFQIAVLALGLTVLTFILLFQDWLTRYPRLISRLRVGFLLYTLFFIGWYSLAQLSVVNVLTFTGALMTEFNWETFLLDPLIFILWAFVAVTLLLWGRGVFCGWLCPFGALQELVNKVARKVKIPQYELPFAVHERLWALKYLILLFLFAVSLHSLGQAEVYAEVEPFKTAILMQFQREWGFVIYALGLVLVSAFTNKFYCRYVCPLGAALAVPARLRLFDWLKRHPNDCGQPCQICANECEVQAIHPDGRINPNECHHCLDCQVTYWNDRKCPPMVKQRKRHEKAAARAGGGFPEIHVPASAGKAKG